MAKKMSSLVASIKKKVTQIQEEDKIEVPFFVDSGNYALNYVLSGSFVRGYPGGRVIEVYGDPSTGKTLLITHAVVDVQQKGGVAVIDDIESSYNMHFARMLGANTEDIIILNSIMLEDFKDPKTKEVVKGHYASLIDIVNLIRKQEKDVPVLICLDSIANLTTEHEATTELAKQDMSKAKVIKKFMRLVGKYIKDQKICYLASNHTIATMSMYGDSATSPGGGGFKFQATTRLELTYRRKIFDANGKKCIGVTTAAYGKKSKVTIPFRRCELDIYWDKGVDRTAGLWQLALDENVITKASANTYNLPGYEKPMYRKVIEEMIATNPEDVVKKMEAYVQSPEFKAAATVRPTTKTEDDDDSVDTTSSNTEADKE